MERRDYEISMTIIFFIQVVYSSYKQVRFHEVAYIYHCKVLKLK